MQDASKPIWIETNKKPAASNGKPVIFVATPVHSECSIHYTQALLSFQLECMKRGIMASFSLLKSSLVTQGRNLCVSNMFEQPDHYTHLLFIDSDIFFEPKTIFDMLEKDLDVLAAPYPMKTLDWNKIYKRNEMDKAKGPEELSSLGYTFPIKIENENKFTVEKGVMEVTHAPTGCMLVKRSVFERMMKHYPELKINQPSIINGKEEEKPYFYNFYDTLHDPKTKRYYGEDFGFCQRWRDMGGKCFIYVLDPITHVGEYHYTGRLMDDLVRLKKVDDK